MRPLLGSPAGSLWKEMPITRDLFYITFRVPSKGAPFRFPSQSSHRERCCISRVPSSAISQEFLVNGPPMIVNRALVEKGAHLQSLLKSPVDEPPAKFTSEAPHGE